MRVITNRRILPTVDLLILPFVYVSALLLKFVRIIGVQRLPHSKSLLLRVGCFPLRSHYYEPAFDNQLLRSLLATERELPGIDFNDNEQLGLLGSFSYADELSDWSTQRAGGDHQFHLHNGAFESGDAEYWYSIIRYKKPKIIIEVGAGHSTLVALQAIRANEAEDPNYKCTHTVIEPYEHPWLDELGIKIVREKVEDTDRRMFSELGHNDIFFIDSSHVIRPHGDVLAEYLDILPRLCDGVIVHIHDIFSPKDYPASWVVDEVRLWNEQYLLEAFLTLNNDWKVIGALNYLSHHHFDKMKEKCPFLTMDREPGSFYIQRVTGSRRP